MHPPTTQTLLTAPKKAVASGTTACLVHIYPTGPTMGGRTMLDAPSTIIGRGDDCDVQIQDHSVSRRHVQIQRTATGYIINDLQSTNGTFVNDQPTGSTLLHDGDYLRIGNNIYRFLAGGNVEAEYHEEIYRLTIIDGLTQTHNRRYLLEFLDRELARSNRHQRPLAVIMFDIDWFKTINDELGHLGGDCALRGLADCVQNLAVRREDLFSRYGGDEFALVLVETEKDAAVQVAERIRSSIEAHAFQFEGRPFSLTLSIGVGFTNGENSLTAPALIQLADDRLYEAKKAGRNRVVS